MKTYRAVLSYYLRLTLAYIRLSILGEMAHRGNFLVNVLYSLLNLATGVLGLLVIFGQIRTIGGWTFASSLALLGVYQIIGALRSLCIGPSLNTLAGLDGDIWTGRFDFILLRPVDVQFLASVSTWRIFALLDLAVGLGELGMAVSQLSATLTVLSLAEFVLALFAAILILYALLLIFSALVLWSPSFLFTWVFDGFFQLARYPVGLYPGWLRLILTWVIPVGILTTFPAEAITGVLSLPSLLISIVVAITLFVAASLLFHSGVRHYASASS